VLLSDFSAYDTVFRDVAKRIISGKKKMGLHVYSINQIEIVKIKAVIFTGT